MAYPSKTNSIFQRLHIHHRAQKFSPAHFSLENFNLFAGTHYNVFNSAKASGQPFPSVHNHIGASDKTTTSFTISPTATQVESRRVHLERDQETNLAVISSCNTGN
ncbi:hypothetical protein V6N13_131047 [Hibiscus sabdariffa]